MKFHEPRRYADADVAAHKIVELANSLEPYMDNRLLIEKINGPFLFELRGTPEEYNYANSILKRIDRRKA
jgi:hypothetical protein